MVRAWWSWGAKAREHFGLFLPEVPSLEAGAQGLCLPGLGLLASVRCTTLQFDPFAISSASPRPHLHHLAFQLVPCSFPVPKILVPELLKLACRRESPGISSKCRFQFSGSQWLEILHFSQAPRSCCCCCWGSMFPRLSSQGLHPQDCSPLTGLLSTHPQPLLSLPVTSWGPLL